MHCIDILSFLTERISRRLLVIYPLHLQLSHQHHAPNQWTLSDYSVHGQSDLNNYTKRPSQEWFFRSFLGYLLLASGRSCILIPKYQKCSLQLCKLVRAGSFIFSCSICHLFTGMFQCFYGKISSPTRKNSIWFVKSCVFSGAGTWKESFPNFFPIFETNKTPETLLLPYCPTSTAVKL